MFGNLFHMFSRFCIVKHLAAPLASRERDILLDLGREGNKLAQNINLNVISKHSQKRELYRFTCNRKLKLQTNKKPYCFRYYNLAFRNLTGLLIKYMYLHFK